MNESKKKILLTGGTGFLGRFFVRLLIKAGYMPVLLVRESGSLSALDRVNDLYNQEEVKQMIVLEGDLTDIEPDNIPNQWHQLGPIEAMYHIAGLVKFDTELKDTLHRVNVIGTKHAVELAKKLKIERFFYVSTAYTAGVQRQAEEVLHPLDNGFNNPYEESKCLAEHTVISSRCEHFQTTILRPSIIIGDSVTGEADTQFSIYGFLRGLSLFKRKAEKQIKKDNCEHPFYFPLSIQGDPEGLSNLVPVNYVAEVMLTALENECKHDIYHLTNPIAPTKQLLLEVFAELLQVKGMALVNSIDHKNMWDKRFEKFMSVYKPYMQNDPEFAIENTKNLLTAAKKNLLHLQKEDYIRIFKPALAHGDHQDNVVAAVQV
ncbi:SDR family oxidoreductase [Caldalkalibacillus salinus]|uniref:SDR family oxidoreductase n=1 Tax=Caldalkalibacillus salinus TaxID=2803787 RepID=UPI0019248D9D|nr:SDR family oxidoreductase [Caldalkalibacillus salinus]